MRSTGVSPRISHRSPIGRYVGSRFQTLLLLLLLLLLHVMTNTDWSL
jgi:hypothetical protein